MPAAQTGVSAERVRAAFSSAAGATTLLQRRLPDGSAEMVALESPAALSGDEGGQGETERPKPALPGTGAPPETFSTRSGWGAGEGNHSQLFSKPVATGRAAMRDSTISGEVPYNTSAHTRAGGHWNGSTDESGAGNRHVFKPEILIVTARRPYIQPV